MRYLVLGAGGTGGYFGGRLAESGADVTFLVRDGRRKSLVERGLRLESQFGDARIAVKTVTAPEVAPVYDAVILTCKAYEQCRSEEEVHSRPTPQPAQSP